MHITNYIPSLNIGILVILNMNAVNNTFIFGSGQMPAKIRVSKSCGTFQRSVTAVDDDTAMEQRKLWVAQKLL